MDTWKLQAGVCFLLLWLDCLISASPGTSFCPDRCDCQHPQHLMCTNRGLRTVPKPTARVPEDVLVFSLGGNFIGNISAFDFTRYSNLIRLNLQYNQIQIIHPKAFEKLSKLEELYLGHNLLSTISAGTLQPLKKLTVLYSNNNNIKKITSELFANLESLVKLRLDGNAIELLQDSVFKSLTNLHHLHLESNRLQHVHRNAFSKLTSLRFLNLAHNKQTAVRNVLTFAQLKALTTLLLSENEIQYIGSHVFQNLKKLSTLSLSNNRISHLDSEALKGLSSLRELLIDGNNLEEIPAGLLDPLERIEQLDFSHNRISNVDSLAFSQLKHLRVLKLKNNLLTSLSGDIFRLNSALYDLDLYGNNWTCDCRLRELKTWMIAAHSQGKLLTVFVQCHHPVTLRGKYLDYVNSSLLQPQGNLTHFCGSQIETEDNQEGGVLVKTGNSGRSEGDAMLQLEKEWRDDDDEEEGQVEEGGRKNGQVQEGEGARLGRTKKGNGDDEDVRIQGDQEEPEVGGPSPSLETDKEKTESLSPRLAAGKRAKGRRRSNVMYIRGPPATSTTSPAGNQDSEPHTGLVTASPVQPDEKFDLLSAGKDDVLPVIADPCVFNHHFITNVSVDQITSSTATVHWTAKEHHRYTPGPGSGRDEVHYRILFDRFGTLDRFPRYVYASGIARSVTLRELSSEVTYMVCVEGVVGRSVCQVAPRDHCAGLVTLPQGFSRGSMLTSDLQLVTVATLAGNAVLLLVIGGVWLGRSLRRRMQRRKSAVHVRHMYSTRRSFRPSMAAAAVSADFTSYQSSRPARLGPLEEGDLIEFPCDRFLDNSYSRRDSDMQRFND
ncbi:TLR4 interactor with leucine rich repeats [Thalassophryne amazonica]|uniref:TLR4 interactor with leucine rich repeats n=1 Tax=Thalassophryne amazonica TaxID=390379 RepID=UPI001471066D|nr:TLR4 interactor with leucine rich repeats [Thalassophryne amazonica]